VGAIKDVSMKVKFFEKPNPKSKPGLHGIGLGICLGLAIGFGLGDAQTQVEVRYFSPNKKYLVVNVLGKSKNPNQYHK